jgi:glutamate formiminotransferase/formiminotetrahydrofolate cyclodeaminase
VNFNLNTKDTAIANAIAREVREKGYHGKAGTLKTTKAIGWYIEEYGIAQVSMNLCNINVTPLHAAFCEVSRCASKHGVSVTGTEIIGLVPLCALTEAGRYFMQERNDSTEPTEESLVNEAIATMNLSDLRPFNPKQKIIDYLLQQ